MIPLQLTLKNFLSYREATLDFRGLHTACICGPNGAGKSSLLEAITWVLWGQSRTTSDEEAINSGANEARVDFTFGYDREVYRVIRNRRRGGSPALDLQIQTETGTFRTLSGRSVRATQQQIVSLLKLDYDTFINSAYLRQGRADEFMLRRPSERKQILADLLKLERYEALSEQAKDLAKQYKGSADRLEANLQPLKEQLQRRDEIARDRTALQGELERLNQEQERDRAALTQLQAIAHQRKNQQEKLTWQQDRSQNLAGDRDRLNKEREALQGQIARHQQLLDRESEIVAGFQHYRRLQAEEARLNAQFQTYQEAQQKLQALQKQQSEQINDLELKIRSYVSQLESLAEQERELDGMLENAEDIANALVQLQQHRDRLQHLDDLQLQVTPLLQHRHQLQVEIERAQARLNARLEQLHHSATQLAAQVEQVPQVRSQVVAVEAELQDLEKKEVRRQWVTEKGQERRAFRERLQETQRTFEKEIAELGQKLEMLQIPDAICPLCERPLGEREKQQVIHKTQTQQEDTQKQFWVLREQMTTCERELQVLREEYKSLTDALTPYDRLLQRRGQLEAHLENTDEIRDRLAEVAQEKARIEQSLAVGNYALELYTELQNVEQELKRLNYDEQTHALVRGQVKKWNWAEIKSAKLEDARRRKERLATQKPKLQQHISQLRGAIAQLREGGSLHQQIAALEQQIEQMAYDRHRHNEIIQAGRRSQEWYFQYQHLQNARQEVPQQRERLQELEQLLQQRLAELDAVQGQIAALRTELAQTSDRRQDIRDLEQQILKRRQQLDERLAKQGRLEQATQHLETVREQHEQTKKELEQAKRQSRIYQELAQAFGKNGIQALTIENVLPQLEAETNHILSRLTGNQLHVQFITQKAGKGKSKKKTTKLIDTLDILIADARGTRAYETYSGGEGFRINFSIRLALAKLLAQRAGTALQLLIVDEGFGTQDSDGCDRLIAAINAIAPDFACILAVTHMPQFKEAFQYRIEVRKTPNGSQVAIYS